MWLRVHSTLPLLLINNIQLDVLNVLRPDSSGIMLHLQPPQLLLLPLLLLTLQLQLLILPLKMSTIALVVQTIMFWTPVISLPHVLPSPTVLWKPLSVVHLPPPPLPIRMPRVLILRLRPWPRMINAHSRSRPLVTFHQLPLPLPPVDSCHPRKKLPSISSRVPTKLCKQLIPLTIWGHRQQWAHKGASTRSQIWDLLLRSRDLHSKNPWHNT